MKIIKNMDNRLKFGQCRCCLSTGRHRNLNKQYNMHGKRVVYQDCLSGCFNIFLTTHPQLSTLICSTCVKQLQAACKFKASVLKTENQLLNSLDHAKETEFVDVLLPTEEGAVESVKEEVDSDNNAGIQHEEGAQTEYTDYDKNESSFISIREKDFLTRFSSDTLKPLPKRSSLMDICPAFFGHLESLKGRNLDTNTVKELIRRKTRKRKRDKRVCAKTSEITSAKHAQVTNAAILLENSTATVFKGKMRSGFPCFYCRNIFINPKTLREHQIIHPKSNLYTLLKKYSADTLVVYADVTDLKCTLCKEKLANLDTLKIHLSLVHGKKLFEEYTDRVIPFKLEDKENNYECQVCGKFFETFGATEKHMRVHYNHFVCEECGASFVTKHRLKVHTYRLHDKRTVILKCEPCKKIFFSKFRFKIHNENVHKKLKKSKCNLCSDSFIDYFTRQRHLEEKHGVDLLSYKCKECDRSFNRKYTLTCHIKRVHLSRKDVQCELCPYMCYDKSELTKHMYKHGIGKSFECSFCEKSFARKSALTIHMQTHSSEKKFTCHICGEVFLHSFGLKSHLKVHSTHTFS